MPDMSKPTFSTNKQGGFTLVELMVGLLLGLLTVLVISQVLTVAEGKKRSVTMGSDAQVNGALALHTLQSDIQMAGYGATVSTDALGCLVKRQFDATGTPFTFPLAPVVITDGTNGAPDIITVLQGRTSGFSVPMILTEDHPKTTAYFTVASTLGAVASNMMIVVPKVQGASTWCTLFNATNDASATETTLSTTRLPHAAGAGGKWNQSAIFPDAGYLSGSYVLNMGSMVYRSYSVDSTLNFAVTELSPTTGGTNTQELFPQIVNLQAMYGKDTDGDGVVDRYDTTTPTTNAGWLQVLAIRVAVVARSNQYERDEVTASNPQWDVGATSTIALKVDNLPDWKHYRYKVYDTVIPLRNMLWNS